MSEIDVNPMKQQIKIKLDQLIEKEKSKIKLKPCPFCGGEAKFGTVEKLFAYGSSEELECVFCSKCAATIEVDENPDAIAAWNTRKPVDAVLERLERLAEAEYNKEDLCDDDGFCSDGECIYDDGFSAGKYYAYREAVKIIRERMN